MADSWRDRAAALRRDVAAVALALRDPRVPWPVKLLAFLVVAYAFSPIDVIPDVVPFAGALDDLIIVPAGVALVLYLIPPEVMDDCRARAHTLKRRAGWAAAGALLVGVLWVGALVLVGRWLYRWWTSAIPG